MTLRVFSRMDDQAQPGRRQLGPADGSGARERPLVGGAKLLERLIDLTRERLKKILRGDRLIVDMSTGTSREESTSGPVQAEFDSAGSGQSGSGPTSIIPGAKK